MQEAPGVRIVKAGRRTYFIDTLKTKEGKGYLSITESKVTDFEKNTHLRSKILVFGEAITNFAKEVAEAAKTI